MTYILVCATFDGMVVGGLGERLQKFRLKTKAICLYWKFSCGGGRLSWFWCIGQRKGGWGRKCFEGKFTKTNNRAMISVGLVIEVVDNLIY